MGLRSWGRLKPINLRLASVTQIDGLMMRTGIPVPDPAATLLVLYGSYALRYISRGTFFSAQVVMIICWHFDIQRMTR